jgi:glycerophosphoryl diester phosphodiesterase
MFIVGHRGAAGLAAENTLAAFEKALDNNVDQIEFDLWVTGDGQVVVNHDQSIIDSSGNRLQIATNDFKELKKHKSDLIRFNQLLDYVGQATILYIEIKPGLDIQPIVNIIRQRISLGWPKEQLRLASFDQQILLDLKQKLPELDTIVIENWFSLRAAHRAKQLDTRYISMNQKWLYSGFIRAANSRGWKLYAYTLNDRAKALRWQKAGLYAVVTNYPDIFKNR